MGQLFNEPRGLRVYCSLGTRVLVGIQQLKRVTSQLFTKPQESWVIIIAIDDHFYHSSTVVFVIHILM